MLNRNVQLLIFVLSFVFTSKYYSQIGEPGDTIYVANWNVENLFDTNDDPGKNDSEFLPESKKQWTEDKVEKKLKNLTTVINYMNSGCGPDLIGFEEVENINILKRLIYKLPDRDYIMCYRESPDERGIDACLLYDRTVFDIVDLKPIHVEIPSQNPTRDILFVTLRHKISGSLIHVFVNHWPSRIGGEEKSEPNRIAAAAYLRYAVNSIMNKKNEDGQIIMLGDFNDEPGNKSIEDVLDAHEYNCNKSQNIPKTLINLAYQSYKEKKGSYLYGSKWNMLDQIIISPDFIDGRKLDYLCDSFEIIKPTFMIVKEGKRKNGPKPTFEGSKYIGGFSDHFPVAAKFFYRKGSK